MISLTLTQRLTNGAQQDTQAIILTEGEMLALAEHRFLATKVNQMSNMAVVVANPGESDIEASDRIIGDIRERFRIDDDSIFTVDYR